MTLFFEQVPTPRSKLKRAALTVGSLASALVIYPNIRDVLASFALINQTSHKRRHHLRPHGTLWWLEKNTPLSKELVFGKPFTVTQSLWGWWVMCQTLKMVASKSWHKVIQIVWLSLWVDSRGMHSVAR